MRNERLVVLVIAITIGFMMAAPFAAKAAAYEDKIGVVVVKPNEPVAFGFWCPIVGPDASYGIDCQRGTQMAIEESGGKLLGHPIKLNSQDAGCNSEGGQTAAARLASEQQMVAIIGPCCSTEARGGLPILWKAGIPVISGGVTGPMFTAPDRLAEYNFFLRTIHNDKIQGRVAAEYVWKEFKAKTAATIHDGGPYTEGIVKVFIAEFKKMGGTITSEEAVAPTDTDMHPVLTRIAATKPDVLFYPLFATAAGSVTRQMKEVKGLENTKRMMADTCSYTDTYKAAGEEGVGIRYTATDLGSFGKSYKDFVARYEKKYGEKPLSSFTAHHYDATMMVIASIQKVAQKAPDGTLQIGRMKLRDALYAIKDFQGLTGRITCDQYGDCAAANIAVFEVGPENVSKLTVPDKPIWRP